MSMLGATPQSSGYSRLRRVLIHLLLLLLFWILLMFVVIPWETDGQYPPDSFALIEGQRAYAEIVRRERPNLITTLRGLNMARVQFAQEVNNGQRAVSFGNIIMYFDLAGNYRGLDILH